MSDTDTKPEPVRAYHQTGDGWSVNLYEEGHLVLVVYAPTQAHARHRASAVRKFLHKAGLYHDLTYEP